MNELLKRLYVPDRESWLEFCTKNYHSDRQLTVKTVENGIILPTRKAEGNNPCKCHGGVCDENLNFVAGYTDMINDPWLGSYVVEAAYEVDRAEIVKFDETVIFGGLMIYHFGHFLTETLARMWYIIKNPSIKNKIAFVAVKVTRLQVIRPWVYEFFELLGVSRERILIIERPTQFKSVIIPDQAVYLRSSFTDEFLTPYRYLVEKVPPSPPKKIFLSRSAEVVSLMHLCNQKYFEDFYRARGFEVIYPEKLSLAEQISLIGNAGEIVTFLGSLSHWALFCRPNVKFTMLTRVDNAKTVPTKMRQSLIDEATGIDWQVVSLARSFLYAEQGGGCCLLGPTKYWRQYVRDRFGEKIAEENIPFEAVDDYVRRWCTFFNDDHQHHWIDSTKTLYRRLEALKFQYVNKRPLLFYEAHVARRGWLPTVIEGEIGGVIDQKLKLQALKINFAAPFCDVHYSVYYPKEGWSEEVSNNQPAGTVGKDKAIYGVRVRLNDGTFDVRYRVHDFDGNWSEWGGGGEKIISDQMINAVQIKIVPRGGE